jgi:enoyl-CoA hydratase
MSVKLERHGPVAVITMDDGRANAVNRDLCVGLSERLDEALESRAVVLVGRPKVFSAGLDLHFMRTAERDDLLGFLDAFSKLLRKLMLYPRPIVAACTGHALGAGSILLVACDERIGVPGGNIGVTGVRVGFPFPASALALIRACLGEPHATRAILLGEPVSGERRLGEGWLHEVTSDETLVERAVARATEHSVVHLDIFEQLRRELRSGFLAALDAEERAAKHFAEDIASSEGRRKMEEQIARLRRGSR